MFPLKVRIYFAASAQATRAWYLVLNLPPTLISAH